MFIQKMRLQRATRVKFATQAITNIALIPCLLELLQHGVETSSTVLRLPRKYGYK